MNQPSSLDVLSPSLCLEQDVYLFVVIIYTKYPMTCPRTLYSTETTVILSLELVSVTVTLSPGPSTRAGPKPGRVGLTSEVVIDPLSISLLFISLVGNNNLWRTRVTETRHTVHPKDFKDF